MPFTAATYANLVSERSTAQGRLFPQYGGNETHFDVVVAGSGMGGGILADDLADRLGSAGSGRRVLVLEAGSYLFPTHVYNLCRFPNADVASRYEAVNFTQPDDGGAHFLGAHPQLNFGGRSIFWSGLIPSVRRWELEFFPPQVRAALADGGLDAAGEKLNQSVTMGKSARAIVDALCKSPLVEDFDICETPRALHQPYLTPAGLPAEELLLEPTGVFNTAELLLNQVWMTGDDAADNNARRPAVLLNHYVEAVAALPGGGYEVRARDVLADAPRIFTAGTVVLAGGSTESPKILRRSPVFDALPAEVAHLVGRGLTDHPTTTWLDATVSEIGDVHIPRACNAKIVFYSRGARAPGGRIRYPFNIEMNVNHEFWHLREDDPSMPATPIRPSDPARLQLKVSFANCLDDENLLVFDDREASHYVPQLRVKNLGWVDDLAANRFRVLAGWTFDTQGVWDELNGVLDRIISLFTLNGNQAILEHRLGQDGTGFGWGTVHHSCGTLRMPARAGLDAGFSAVSVVDEDLQVHGHPGLYVCDMSVMPLSSAANPVRTLAALALRLSERIASG